MHLQMPQNGIRVEGVKALSKAISSNRNLEFLDLNDNIVTEEGAGALAPALGKADKLRNLDLGDCLIRSKGFLQIMKALRDGNILQNLEHLCLAGNEIGNTDSVSFLMDVFCDDTLDLTGLTLDLESNDFTPNDSNDISQEASGRLNLLIK